MSARIARFVLMPNGRDPAPWPCTRTTGGCATALAGTARLAMPPRLPPPDPLEPSDMPSDGALPVSPPAAVFLMGAPTREQDRLCDAILEFRPGLLLVCVRA